MLNYDEYMKERILLIQKNESVLLRVLRKNVVIFLMSVPSLKKNEMQRFLRLKKNEMLKLIGFKIWKVSVIP